MRHNLSVDSAEDIYVTKTLKDQQASGEDTFNGGKVSARRSIINLKKLGQSADKDATLIANRIQMLENEQSRIMKKIQNSRKRAE